MPELPEVEHFRRVFQRLAAGKRVAGVWADPTILRNATVEALGRALTGRRLHDPTRRGKWLVCPSDGPTLLLHFGMTGDLVWSGDVPSRHRHDRLALAFVEGGELRYRNLRKLGGVWLAHDDAEVDDLLAGLGPDALAVDAGAIVDRLAPRRGGVKAALMDQSFVAGIGNILADEILWQARLHPRRRVEALDVSERWRLARVTGRVLNRAVEEFDDPDPRSWLSPVRGLPAAACPRCRTPLRRTTAAGRTTYFCPHCQPEPAGPTMRP